MKFIKKLLLFGIIFSVSGWALAQVMTSKVCVRNITACQTIAFTAQIDSQKLPPIAPGKFATATANLNQAVSILKAGTQVQQFKANAPYFSVFISNPDQQCQNFLIFYGTGQSTYDFCSG